MFRRLGYFFHDEQKTPITFLRGQGVDWQLIGVDGMRPHPSSPLPSVFSWEPQSFTDPTAKSARRPSAVRPSE
jgi:hypothetical protein